MNGVNWREVLTWSCESEGSGEILFEENGFWSLIRCSPNSSGIIQEKTLTPRVLTLGKGHGNNCGQHVLEKAFISHCPPHTFNCFTSKIGWNFDKKEKQQIYFHNRCSYLPKVPILVEGTIYIYIYINIYTHTHTHTHTQTYIFYPTNFHTLLK